jgi:hypothetical protein
MELPSSCLVKDVPESEGARLNPEMLALELSLCDVERSPLENVWILE